MSYTVRPLSDRTWVRPEHRRQPTRFSAKWSETEDLLLAEVGRLRGRDLVIEVDVSESDLKLDGTLRARAQASSPAVVVAFESKHGPMLYRCDTFYAPYSWQGPAWQHNVRAIALTLDALRTVDRYGATDTGQQYQGFKALPAGRAMPASHMTHQDAVYLLDEYTDRDWSAGDPADLQHVYRRARAAAHPDRHGGDRTLWDQVEQAAQVLGVGR